MVRLACARHLRDLKEGQRERGLRWDIEAANRAINFFPDVLCFYKGESAGKPFDLEPWEAFIVGSLFGWFGPDGHRRFRTAYIEIGKGNGKTPLAAGIGLYGLVADGTPGAEIYAAATTLDQAGVLFTDAKAMVAKSPPLSAYVQQRERNLAVLKTSSFFRAISSENRGLDGRRVAMALIDEIHEHPNSFVVDKMRAGTKEFPNAIILEITNSGYDRQSVCWQHHEYSEKVMSGTLRNDAWFAYVCQLDACEKCEAAGHLMANPSCDECDDWRDEAVWLKANPNLGVSIALKYLRELVAEAEGMPGKQNIVLRLNFCIWTQQVTRWLDMALVATCVAEIKPLDLRGRRCHLGLDLARVNDLSALALLFPPLTDGEKWRALMSFWVPKDNIMERARRDRVPYDQWEREGHLIATPGNVTDFGFIEKDVLEAAGLYDVVACAYDRTFADQLVYNLADEGITMVPFGQGWKSMAAPTAELQRLIGAGEIELDDNPVLTWNLSNVAVKTDPAGNIKPDKEHSLERIDGVVAILNALGWAMQQEGDGTSVYEKEKLLVV